MRVVQTLITMPRPCSYLPDQEAVLEYHFVAGCSAREYGERMNAGWRRFGYGLFHPVCPACNRCQSIRIPVETFRPNRAQRRAMKANEDLTLRIGPPQVDDIRLELHDRYHEFQSHHVGWSPRGNSSRDEYEFSFVQNPFATLEFTYWLGGKLLAVCYVDDLPVGLSAIYCFYDPDERDRSPGTFNVLQVIEHAKIRRRKHVYLGYFVEGCRSLEYKANFTPNEVLDLKSGQWKPFRE
jgi:leucyl-tRNA---protein transferase